MNKWIKIGFVLAIVGLIFIKGNPMGYNEPTERTVVTQWDGKQFVQFKPGVFYSGFFAKEVSWPNQLSVSYTDPKFSGDFEVRDNIVEVGPIKGQFNGGDEAWNFGIVQYILPNGEKEMLEIHNAHRTPEALVQRRLAPYTKECLGASSQLMSSEMHYSGGKAQMVQEYISQLRYGSYLLSTTERNVYDSTTLSYKKIYESSKQIGKDGQPLRKFSSIKEYNIVIGDAQITDTRYSDQILAQLTQKIKSATEASISKQKLMTAEQQKLTAKAQGEQKLTEIEYQQKQEQTRLVVAAQTTVQLAQQDKLKQQIQYEASILEAKKVRELADGEAYAKAKVMAADGALDKKLAAYKEVSKYWADALGSYQGNIVPMYSGGGEGKGTDGWTMFSQAMGAKAMQDLNLNMKNK